MPNVFWAKVSKENTVIRVNLVSFLQSEKVATCPVIGETVLVVVSNGEYYLQGFITNHVQSLSKDNTLNPATVRFGLKDFVDKRNLTDSSDPEKKNQIQIKPLIIKMD